MLLWAVITDTYVVTDFDIHHHFSYHTYKHNSNKCAQKLVFKVKESTTSVSVLEGLYIHDIRIQHRMTSHFLGSHSALFYSQSCMYSLCPGSQVLPGFAVVPCHLPSQWCIHCPSLTILETQDEQVPDTDLAWGS